ncbi:hydrogenase subunit MbhD domain-containing protein [Alkalimonas sp. NCh-2]|uniref:hydrogenase subunit MbhD domain-containing protein n=1 Tax=Alkalimonas sp. NCh-2 TaxID=3144846 RepID=UPI0031F6DB5F
MSGDFWFDALLGVLLLVLALATILARQLAAAVMLYVVFGLMLALAWARLGAADLALAEAAIGAGLTGALLFSALARQPKSITPPVRISRMELLPALVLCIAMSAVLGWTLWQLPLQPAHSQLPAALEQLGSSGTEHLVTAVLLNFRAWDTLLELLVLLLALLGSRLVAAPEPAALQHWPLARQWSIRLLPLLVLVAFFVLWRGATAPGGAFQAGALLAAALVVLRLNGQLPALRFDMWWVRALILAGVLAFLLAGLLSVWLNWQPEQAVQWLRWPLPLAKGLILLIELCATLAIGLTLTLLVVGERKELTA